MAAPLCRYCGKTISKKTVTVYFSQNMHDRKECPKDKAEAQKLFNEKVVLVRFKEIDGERSVSRVDLWDGESYRDKHFCKDLCAQFFGRMMAEHNKTVSTTSYFKALDKRKSKENGKA